MRVVCYSSDSLFAEHLDISYLDGMYRILYEPELTVSSGHVDLLTPISSLSLELQNP